MFCPFYQQGKCTGSTDVGKVVCWWCLHEETETGLVMYELYKFPDTE